MQKQKEKRVQLAFQQALSLQDHLLPCPALLRWSLGYGDRELRASARGQASEPGARMLWLTGDMARASTPPGITAALWRLILGKPKMLSSTETPEKGHIGDLPQRHGASHVAVSVLHNQLASTACSSNDDNSNSSNCKGLAGSQFWASAVCTESLPCLPDGSLPPWPTLLATFTPHTEQYHRVVAGLNKQVLGTERVWLEWDIQNAVFETRRSLTLFQVNSAKLGGPSQSGAAPSGL